MLGRIKDRLPERASTPTTARPRPPTPAWAGWTTAPRRSARRAGHVPATPSGSPDPSAAAAWWTRSARSTWPGRTRWPATTGCRTRPRRCCADEWYVGGDLGSVSADGVLRVLGRREDAILKGGVWTQPVAVEEAAAALDGVAEAGAVGVPAHVEGQDAAEQQILLAVVARSGHSLDAAKLARGPGRHPGPAPAARPHRGGRRTAALRGRLRRARQALTQGDQRAARPPAGELSSGRGA